MAIEVSSARLIPVLRRIVAVKKFAKLHPTLIPFMLYLAVSGIALFYVARLLNSFGFSALKHIGISDFLTVIMTNFLFLPAFTIVVFCSGQLILATVLESWYLTSDSFGAKPAL
ncbi:hypothetical protein CBQ28_22260 [Pseudoalteromonas sp. GCY]|uniref:hypothetical protein n=1 Tax=Pseudoalteromonas sp. GCY TaxID=2003316 RepID=UPI000BFF08FC|nr:hypothetical protein [Pseudoalteromonas sp. GCY]PHI34887.1 hypothetical protein CBQ28_22260 [Pseudoalteromonas sp. GCY]